MSCTEKIFNSIDLPKDHKDAYIFFWFDINDESEKLLQFRSTCHLFGSKASPAIANFGLLYASNQPVAKHFPEASNFIKKSFYVDDGIQ